MPAAEKLTRSNLEALLKKLGSAEKVDLSHRTFEEGADLSHLDLRGIRLVAATLRKCNLSGSDLSFANLSSDLDVDQEYGRMVQVELHTDLRGADLSSTILIDADLSGARLAGASLRGAYLSGNELAKNVDLTGIEWGNGQIGQELEGKFECAARIYRLLNQVHLQANLRDTAAKFYYREMECRRKALSWRKEPHRKLWRIFLWLFGGYGERPFWILGWWVAALVFFTLLTWMLSFAVAAPSIASSQVSLSLASQGGEGPSALKFAYYNAVSLTALGYGNWVDEPPELLKLFGPIEAFAGSALMGMFVAYLARWLTR